MNALIRGIKARVGQRGTVADHVLTAELIHRLKLREGRGGAEMILPIRP